MSIFYIFCHFFVYVIFSSRFFDTLRELVLSLHLDIFFSVRCYAKRGSLFADVYGFILSFPKNFFSPLFFYHVSLNSLAYSVGDFLMSRVFLKHFVFFLYLDHFPFFPFAVKKFFRPPFCHFLSFVELSDFHFIMVSILNS